MLSGQSVRAVLVCEHSFCPHEFDMLDNTTREDLGESNMSRQSQGRAHPPAAGLQSVSVIRCEGAERRAPRGEEQRGRDE